ncbi:MAG: hypothetical protein H0T89_16870 [Deltaproteobacteria bacterium]|nr:hypothetical protein [Deltaproteobacteria bacterium]MDQ3297029.1 hypothetical protein [Myxococcota bacterium]
MEYLHGLLLIVGGVLALSAFIIAKKPDAKALLDKVTPFQAFIGVALLVVGLIRLIQIGPINVFRILSVAPLLGITLIGATYGAILLGFLFGMPQIAKWIPGESNAETKATNVAKKLAPFQMILGVICLVSGLLVILYQLGILKPF